MEVLKIAAALVAGAAIGALGFVLAILPVQLALILAAALVMGLSVAGLVFAGVSAVMLPRSVALTAAIPLGIIVALTVFFTVLMPQTTRTAIAWVLISGELAR